MFHDDQEWEAANQRREEKNVDEELAMMVVEEIGYSHAVLVNLQPSVYWQGVVDMTHLEGRVSEHVREGIS